MICATLPHHRQEGIAVVLTLRATRGNITKTFPCKDYVRHVEIETVKASILVTVSAVYTLSGIQVGAGVPCMYTPTHSSFNV